MKTLLVFVVLLLALAAYAGTKAAEISNGQLPSSATSGVGLSEVEGCRLSVRSADGGSVNTGTLTPWYYDSVLGWIPANSALDCTLDARRSFDGGETRAQVCPDIVPAAKFGRLSVEGRNLTAHDGGAVPGQVLRVECWGRNIP